MRKIDLFGDEVPQNVKAIYILVNKQMANNIHLQGEFFEPMIGENWQLVTNEPFEFEK